MFYFFSVLTLLLLPPLPLCRDLRLQAFINLFVDRSLYDCRNKSLWGNWGDEKLSKTFSSCAAFLYKLEQEFTQNNRVKEKNIGCSRGRKCFFYCMTEPFGFVSAEIHSLPHTHTHTLRERERGPQEGNEGETERRRGKLQMRATGAFHCV